MAKGNEQLQDLITAIGSIAEMSHQFYTAMITSGATVNEATAGMQSFIATFVHESMESSRRKRQDEEAE